MIEIPGRSSTISVLKTLPGAVAEVDLELLRYQELGVVAALGGADLDDDAFHGVLEESITASWAVPRALRGLHPRGICEYMPNLNWKIVAGIVGVLVLLLVVAAVVTGTQEFFAAAGALGGAAGAAALKRKTGEAKKALDSSSDTARHLASVPREAEAAARTEIAELPDQEKVKLGNKLLGDGK